MIIFTCHIILLCRNERMYYIHVITNVGMFTNLLFTLTRTGIYIVIKNTRHAKKKNVFSELTFTRCVRPDLKPNF